MPIRLGLGLSPVLAADRLPWAPGEMSDMRAWYDAELGQPRYGGDGAYVQLDGASGDYIFTPDSAATSFSNDIEVVMRVKVTDWTAAANQTLAGKYVSTGNQRSWRFYVNTSGAIGLTASTDGTAVTSIIVTPTNALPDNTWIWLRMRLDLTNGSNSVGTLETATDAGTNTEPSSWTANGTNTGTTISGIFDSTAPTEIGTFGSGTLERMTGQVGRCIVRSGFGGTTVVDFNASDCYGDGYWHAGGYRWNLGLPKIYDRSANNRAPATFGSGSNQPLWLPWKGRSQVYLPGASGNYVSAPDAAPLDITGDLELWAWVLPTQSAADSTLVGKYSTASPVNNRAFQFYLVANSLRPAIRWSTDGTSAASTTVTSASDVSFKDGLWVGVTLAASTGQVSFYTLDAEPSTTPTVAAATLHEAPAAVGATSIFASVAALEVGSINFGTLHLTPGLFSRAIVRNGIGGTTVADFNAELCGQSGYTDAYSNVWTVNRATTGRKTVVQSPTARSARSLILLGTDDWIDVPAAAVPALDTFAAASSMTASFRRWHNPGASAHPVFTTKSASGITNIGYRLAMSATAASPSLGNVVGDGAAFDGQGLDITVPLGTRGVATAVVGSSSPFMSARANGDSRIDDTARSTTVTTSTGGAGRIGAYTGGTGVIDMELEALVCRDVATTDTEHGLLVAYYGGGL